ncbi:amidase signature domain-containing protein [Trichoderma sp. SZMC 28014]
MKPLQALATAIQVVSFSSLSHCLPSAHDAFPPLLDATLADLRSGLDKNLFTSVDLVRAYIDRIQEVNPALKAVTEINPDALCIAEERDAERRAGIDPVELPLHGIPVILKDNIATFDKMNNTAGSYALLGAKVPEDSTIASKLRKAGAIILGKANLSQWASSRELVNHEGWSAYGGQVRGAYFPNQDPQGSSSGSAVSSSIGLTWAAVGTDTSGSILAPAHANNVVGFRPTVGLTSRHLVIPFSSRQDTVGTLTRTVMDAAYLMQAMAGPDKHDNYTSAIPFEKMPDYVAACKDSGLKGKRIGVSRDILTPALDVAYASDSAAFDRALDVMRSAGAQVVDNIDMKCSTVYQSLTKPNASSAPQKPPFVTVGVDFLSDLPQKYLSLLTHNPYNITSLEDLRDFTRRDPREGYPNISTSAWDDFLYYGINNTDPTYWPNVTQEKSLFGDDCVAGAIQQHSLDAMVLPTFYAILPASTVGLPVVSVPLGRIPDGAPTIMSVWGNLALSAPNGPFGISFSGLAFSEEKLFAMAYAFEQRTNVRKTICPIVVPKTELADVVRRRCAVSPRSEGCFNVV